MADFPVTFHDKPYPTIDPRRPELSQRGRTVLVTGATAGIGHAIARNFCAAGASKVILTGRRPDVLDKAVSNLASTYPETGVIGKVIDVFQRPQIDKLWDELQNEGTAVDVLVISAVGEPALQPILEQGVDRLWQDFENNVRAPLWWIEKFYEQPSHEGKQKYLVFVSTQNVHLWEIAAQMQGYQVTKHTTTTCLQQIAADTPAEKMQILSFHPAVCFTEAAAKTGYTETTLPWKDENLPGQFAVWAASDEAKFLHGRFVWAEWDMEELKAGEIRKRIDEDPWFLKTGVRGLLATY